MASASESSRGSAALNACYEATLEKLDVPFKTQVVATQFGETHLLIAGYENQDPIILLHGAASNAAACWPLINVQAKTHHVVAIDIPRHLGKTTPFRLSPRKDDFALWLLDILDGFDIQRAHFIGFSFGAWVTLKLAAVANERIAKMVLICPVGVAPFRFGYLLRAPVFFLRALLDPSENSMDGLARLIAGPTAPEPVVREIANDGRVFIQNFHMPTTPLRLSRQALQRCQSPTLVLLGEHDSFCKPDVVRSRLNKNLADGHVEIIPDTGHALIYEQPGLVSARVQEFLDPGT